MLALFHELWGYRMDTVAVALAILLLVLMFPGVNRFGRTGVGVGIDIILSWAWVLSVLGLLGYATNTLSTFDSDMLVAWGIATPLVQWALVAIGTAVQRHMASLPEARRPAVIIGAGRMGMRVAQMLRLRQAFGHELLGVFDDRSADRVNLPEDAVLVGALRQLPEYIEARGVKDVFITLPLTSQPRIQSLLESLQNTTASIHFVPDIFGVSVIQGRLEDMGGVPVVGLMVEPFTGINGFIKRMSDVAMAALILA
ncbi:MAG TPA: undecaprenyl-phosphate glucose phosphotransferase, partial [Burkholderiaceae bacterium]|nr:undecaprenyl-phosphate glucose phosphotransferase [Burkholderiaceae bacterium]